MPPANGHDQADRCPNIISIFAEIWLTRTTVAVKLDGMKLDDAAFRLEALGNPTRLRIYRMLVRAGEPGLPVGHLQRRLKIPASTLSHHLRALIHVGLVTQERVSTTLLCRTNFPLMRDLVDFLVAECCADACTEPTASDAA
jgi:ArsR family transcriptional regulator, arsenate/arsenite/antimonite-responsive transcriptional repressor